MAGKSGHQFPRMFKRLKMHVLIKKIRRTYKYYLTHLRQKVVNTALKLRTMFIIPSLIEPAIMRI